MSSANMLKVRDVMQSDFVVMQGIDTVQAGIDKILDSNVGTIIIDRRDEHDEFGIVLLRDIAERVLSANKAPDRINLYEIMSKPAVGVDPNMGIRYCARLFHNLGIATAPVIEERKVIGLVTYKELVLEGFKHSREIG